jgi:RHS repeat-associated protein
LEQLLVSPGLIAGGKTERACAQDGAFGAMMPNIGAEGSEWRFTGELQDSRVARGLYYLRARYDAALGRFLSADLPAGRQARW